MFRTVGKGVAATAIMTPILESAIVSCAMAAEDAPLNGVAGIDRVTVLTGKTYLRGWAGYGNPPSNVGPILAVWRSSASTAYRQNPANRCHLEGRNRDRERSRSPTPRR